MSAPELGALAARSLRERGFAVLPAIYDAKEIAFLREEVETLWQEVGAPALWAGKEAEGVLRENVERWVTGLVLKKYLKKRPAIARSLLKPAMLEALRSYLGPSFWIESSTVVLSDAGRPYFAWHSHVGGLDEERYRDHGWLDAGPRPARVASLTYLQPVNPANGQLMVLPRTLLDPTEPPHDPAVPDWPGRIEITCPAGSVVLMDQATYHAVKKRSEPGTRIFVGAWFASPAAPAAMSWDDSLDDIEAPTALRRLIDARPLP